MITADLPPIDVINNVETLQDGQIGFKVGLTPENDLERLLVVSEVYRERGYFTGVPSIHLQTDPLEIVSPDGKAILTGQLNEADYNSFIATGALFVFPGGQEVYLDKYHWDSVGLIAKTNQGVIGSARIVMNDEAGLPTLNDSQIEIFPEWEELAHMAKAEFSQFAVLKGEAPFKAATGLLKTAYEYSKGNEIYNWIATIDKIVIRLLNGTYYKFGLPKIGKDVNYMGSISTPVWINFETAIGNASRTPDSRPTAEFLLGQDLDAEENKWYVEL